MKDLIKMFLVIIAALIIVFKVEELARHDDVIKRYNDLQEKAAIEKQIRILKTDLYIMQNGYESE